MQSQANTHLLFVKDIPKVDELLSHADMPADSQVVLFYDEVLATKLEATSLYTSCIKKYALTAGEPLKTLKSFSQHVEVLTEELKEFNHRKLVFVAVGGGSIGDFVGFVASVYKRGVAFVQIPSTWLAAIDSAHGGKTALNIGYAKNQIGSFYPAQLTCLCLEALQGTQLSEKLGALGELIKIAIINRPQLLEKIGKIKDLNEASLWELLPEAIAAKLEVVQEDPLEKSGYRQILNLGHSLGHIVEAELKQAHGLAVAQGLYFAINWSMYKQLLNEKDGQQLLTVLDRFFTYAPKKLDKVSVLSLMQKDKKRADSTAITFVFLEAAGSVLRQSVSFSEFLAELKRQGWLLDE